MSSKILKEVRISNDLVNDWLINIREIGLFGKKIAEVVFLPDESDYSFKFPPELKSKKYDESIDNNIILKEFIDHINITYNQNFYIVQDPYSEIYIRPINFGKKVYALNIDDFIVEMRIHWKVENVFINGIKFFKRSGKYKDMFGTKYEMVEIDNSYILSNLDKFDINNKNKIKKIVEIKYGDSIKFDNEPRYIYYTDKDNNFTENINDLKEFDGIMSDLDIIEQVLNSWKKNVGNDYDIKLVSVYSELYNGINFKEYNTVKFINPISGKNEEKKEISSDDIKPINQSEKIKLNLIGLKDGYNIQVKEEFGFEVIVGDIIIDARDGIDGEDLSDEYTESDFIGLDEEEIKIQLNVSTGIDPRDQEGNIGIEGKDAVDLNTIPKTFDDLLRVAASFVELNKGVGKIFDNNTRITYENLNKNYIDKIHGQCPRGVRAIMYALFGDKMVAKIGGHADWFSFKKPGTEGGNATFIKTGYYNDKIRVSQKEFTQYIDNKSKWVVGDILVCGYVKSAPKGDKKGCDGRFGHIQIWTGWCWMSDFKQNRIQTYNIDYNTIALWRVNEKGAQKIKSRLG